ncbi:MAG: SLC13 family permease [Pirellulaceae bacterium]
MSPQPPVGKLGDRAGPSQIEEAGGVPFDPEARFERARRSLGLWLGPAAFVLFWFLPFTTLSSEAHRLSAVMALVVVWWVTEAIPIPATALIGAALAVVCGITNATEAFAPFASPTVFLFIGSFIIGRAISTHQLDRRLALSLLSLNRVRGSIGRTRAAIAVLCMGVSAWMSNTATTAMMLPVAVGVLAAAGITMQEGRRSYGIGFLLTVAYAASIGGIITPVGTPPNLITLGLLDKITGVKINFLTWILLMTPMAIAFGAIMLVIGARLFPVPIKASGKVPLDFDREQQRMDPWTSGQRNCAIAFGVAVVLWVAPGALAACGLGDLPWVKILTGRLDESVVAIVAATLLFVLPVNWRTRQFTIGWSEASKIDWGTILLFGGGLSLGRLMFVTGLAEHVGHAIVSWSGVETLWGVTAIAAALGILLTETTSNTAATNMLVPVVISIAQANGLNPVVPALAVCLGASMAFMLPISTPPNAIVYGTGLVPLTAMLRFGILLDVVAFVIIVAGLRVLAPLLGLV